MNGAIYVSNSGNTKLKGSSKIDATYTSINSTCPKNCALKDDSCYASLSYVGITSRRLDVESANLTAIQVAKSEVNAIDNCYNGEEVPNRDLRLHVSGDSKTVTGTRLINQAVGRWKERGGRDCWTYTHAWAKVARDEWSNVSVLASIESVSQVNQARQQGYAPALVVPEHPGDKAYRLSGSDTKWIPCPAQTKPGGKEIACSDCRLCFDSNRLFDSNIGITFAAHGVKRSSLKHKLTVIK